MIIGEARTPASKVLFAMYMGGLENPGTHGKHLCGISHWTETDKSSRPGDTITRGRSLKQSFGRLDGELPNSDHNKQGGTKIPRKPQ